MNNECSYIVPIAAHTCLWLVRTLARSINGERAYSYCLQMVSMSCSTTKLFLVRQMFTHTYTLILSCPPPSPSLPPSLPFLSLKPTVHICLCCSLSPSLRIISISHQSIHIHVHTNVELLWMLRIQLFSRPGSLCHSCPGCSSITTLSFNGRKTVSPYLK